MNKKIIMLALTGALSLSTIKTTAYSKELSKYQTQEDTKDIFEYEKIVEATTNVYVRKNASTDANVITLLKKGETLPLVSESNKEWYQVKINDKYGYISKDYYKVKEDIKMNGNMLKVVKITEDSEISSIINKNISINFLPKDEIGEVYEETDKCYLIKTPTDVGYVNKNFTEILDGITVVADISSQELKVYEDNKITLTSPIVSGKPKTPTHLGEYKIYDISHNRELVAPDKSYKSYVDVMMKFNNNEGFHDAEYHTDYDENGNIRKKHGWRSLSEFGGETYLTDGSHGCVNMPHDKAIELSEIVSKGTRVLIKK